MTDAQYAERLHESSWWECGGDKPERWTNPPHRSHQCHYCKGQDGKPFVWRPADVPTNGVAAIKTRGKADSPIFESQAQGVPAEWRETVEQLIACHDEPSCPAVEVAKRLLAAAPQPAQAAGPPKNNPISAMAIRLLVAAGHVSQEKADEAFTIACNLCEAEAKKAGIEWPHVSTLPTQRQEAAAPSDSWHSDDARDTMRHPEASDLGMSMFATQVDYWEAKVQAMVDEAKAAGFVIRVEQVPLKPLAMGNYASKVNINPVLKRGEAGSPRQTFRVSPPAPLPPGATLIDGVAYGPFPIHGAVIENGAIVCCVEHDREPCPHNPLHRCKACPGNKGMQP